jgi:hypothetical protein
LVVRANGQRCVGRMDDFFHHIAVHDRERHEVEAS